MGSSAHMTGIDISRRQLERNHLLNEKIHGDIQTYPLPEKAFDLVICWDVMEHLLHPGQALLNFARCVGPGGHIILKLPNLLSLKGLVTKLTPHFIHVWFYRTFYRRPDAGRDDQSPFKTYLKWSVRPLALRRFSEDQGLDLVYEEYWEAPIQYKIRQSNPLLRLVWTPMGGLLKLFSFGSVTISKTEYLLVIKRNTT
jgi:SAM-dependent methyltransferase